MGEKPIWLTKEFKIAKEKAIGFGKIKNKCEWCGSKENLTPHHTVPFKYYYKYFLRQFTLNGICNELGGRYYPGALETRGGFYLIQENKKEYLKVERLKSYEREHPELKELAKYFSEMMYLSFLDIETLCRRCHFATENNLEICKYCKDGYHGKYKSDFPSCSKEKCREKAKKEEDKFEKEFSEYNSQFLDRA